VESINQQLLTRGCELTPCQTLGGAESLTLEITMDQIIDAIAEYLDTNHDAAAHIVGEQS